MATTVAAMKGKLGSTEYYILAMKAKELVDKAVIPSEIDGWDDMTLEEREQRDINYNRVRSQIAPYLARDKDRFFGAIILAAQNFDSANFESLSDVTTKGLPRLYQTQASLMGFLTFTGGERLIPLDGQHRLKAIRFAIDGMDERSRRIEGLTPSSALADEDVTVILIPHDKIKARKIFTKVNRYAKPTTTGQNLVTDDDDFIAVLSRHVANDIIGPRLVKYTSNAIANKEVFFTTLATIAKCNEAILHASFGEKVPRDALPPSDKRAHYEEKVTEVWDHLINSVDKFSDMLADKTEGGDETREEIRRDFLLGKPIPQLCLVTAFSRLVNLSESKVFSYNEVTERLNKIDWSKKAKLWDRLLMSGERIIPKNEKIATDILCYVLGQPLDDDEEAKLLNRYREIFPESERKEVNLPDKVE